MFDNLNLGNVGRALQIERDAGQPAGLPAGTQDALARTGSSYVMPSQAAAAPAMPDWLRNTQQGIGMVDQLPRKKPGLMNSPMAGAQPGDMDGDGTAHPGLANSPAAGLVKKAISAVAAYYTGGLSAAAMNVGGQMLSQKNPRAGAIAGAAGSFL